MALAEIDRLHTRLEIAKPVIDRLSIQDVEKFAFGWDTVGHLAKLFANFAKPSGEIDLLDGNKILIVGGRYLGGTKFIGVGSYIDNTRPSNPNLIVIGREGGKEGVVTISLHHLCVIKWETSSR